MRYPALLLCLLLLACKGEENRATSPRKGAAESSEAAKPAYPEEPVEFGAAPVPHRAGRLPTDVKLRASPGGKAELGSLLAGNSLVVYLNTDNDDKQLKAATRMLEDVFEAAAPLGFRIVLVFPQGTDDATIDKFYKSRKLLRVGRAAEDVDGAFVAATGWKPRTAALVQEDGEIGVLFPPTDRWDARLGFEGGLNADLLTLAWAPADLGPQVSPLARDAAAAVVRAAQTTEWTGSDLPDAVNALADHEMLRDEHKHGVWVTLFKPGDTKHHRGFASGKRLGEDLARATKAAVDAAGNTPDWRAANIRFAVDMPGEAFALPTRELKPLWYLVEPGVDGLVLRRDGKEGLILPGEAVTDGLLTPRVQGRDGKLKAMFREVCKRAGVSASAWSEPETELLRFRTFGFGVTDDTSVVRELYRGKVLAQALPGEKELLESIRIGGRWLLFTVKEDGKFAYEYYPHNDKTPGGYNIVRHAGSVYGLLEMYRLAGEEAALAADREAYIDAASRAMGWIYDALQVPTGAKGEGRICLMEGSSCESGSNALTLLTLLVKPDKKDVPKQFHDKLYRGDDGKTMEELATTLLDMIDADGRVYRTYDEALKLPKVVKEPLYYPGETMLALALYHERTKDPRWLDGAKRIGDRQVADYDQRRFTFPDHWVMQALTPVWVATKDDKYAESAWAMATHSVSEQYPYMWQPYPDYLGAWRRTNDGPRTTRAGSRMEALRGVVHLAWLKGQDAKDWEDSLILGARHLIEEQFRPETMYWIAKPERALGAYPMGLLDKSIRIDNNQHGLVGILGALEVLRHRAAATPALPEPTPGEPAARAP